MTSISPAAGATLGGNTVTITGTDFVDGATVTIGGSACTSPTVTSLTTLTCVTPAHSSGSVNVVVTTASGSDTGVGLYTYVTPPTATTGAASNISASGATLNGTVNDSGTSTTVTFDYGVTNNPYANTNVAATPSTIAANAGSTAVTTVLTNLACGTTYQFRVSATNVGTTNGSDESFTTSLCTQATLSVLAPASLTYGNTANLSSAGGSGGGAVSYSAGGSTGCAVSGSTLSVTNASGTCAVTATKAGDSSYGSTTSVAVTVTLNKATQTITGFAPASPVTFGATPATLTATGGGSGNLVVFATTSASNICTVSGSTVTFTGAGICNLTANQAGNTNYAAAPQAIASISISAVNSFTAPSPSGGGNISGSFMGGSATCSFATSQLSSQAPPAGVTMGHGVFSFTTSDCGGGSTLNFTITYPTALPAGTRYYKYGPEFGGSQSPHWYELPGAQVVNGNQITFSITDNGVGDGDPRSGFISDPGGPGVPAAGGVAGVPTLSQWGLMILAALVGFGALCGTRRMQR